MPGSILDKARAHYAGAAGLPYPAQFELSERWSHWSALTARAIESFSSVEEAIHFAQRESGFEHRHSAADSKSHWPLYQAALIADFPDRSALIEKLEDSPLSHPQTVSEFEGRRMSNVTFWHAYEFLATFCRVENAKRIVEIGGGLGTLARFWLENAQDLSTYILTDFPESLFYAEITLRSHFPGRRIRYIAQGDGLAALADGEIVLCPAQLASNLLGLSADLAINSGSMQEMTEAAMLWWCDWLQAGQIEHFYSLNYGLQPIQARRGGSANWMCPRLGPNWDAVLLRLDPPIVREQTLRHYREVLFRSTPARERAELEARSLAILQAHSRPVSINREQSVLELLDALRLSPSRDLVMRLVQILGTLYDYRPKELVHVCTVGLSLDDITEEDRQILTELLTELSAIAAEEHAAAIPSKPLF